MFQPQNANTHTHNSLVASACPTFMSLCQLSQEQHVLPEPQVLSQISFYKTLTAVRTCIASRQLAMHHASQI